jgi:rod shape-determining protein MreC
VSRRTRRISASGRSAGSVFPRRKPHLVVRRGVLAGLIFLALALITVSYRGGAVLHGPQLAVLDAVAPIERGLSRAWDPIAGAWNWTGRLFTATNEVPKLERENAELRDQLNSSAIDADDYEAMRRDLGFKDRGEWGKDQGFEWIGGEVIVRPPGAIASNIVIDIGEKDGVSKDDAVVVSGGLLGRVLSVTGSQAVVTLLINDSTNVSASVITGDGTATDAWGVLQTVSTEGTPTLRLGFVQQSTRVKPGNLVMTSGFASKNGELRSLYPRKIPIGVVSSAGNNPGEKEKTVQVTPFANFDEIDRVYVLGGSGGRYE